MDCGPRRAAAVGIDGRRGEATVSVARRTPRPARTRDRSSRRRSRPGLRRPARSHPPPPLRPRQTGRCIPAERTTSRDDRIAGAETARACGKEAGEVSRGAWYYPALSSTWSRGRWTEVGRHQRLAEETGPKVGDDHRHRGNAVARTSRGGCPGRTSNRHGRPSLRANADREDPAVHEQPPGRARRRVETRTPRVVGAKWCMAGKRQAQRSPCWPNARPRRRPRGRGRVEHEAAANPVGCLATAAATTPRRRDAPISAARATP